LKGVEVLSGEYGSVAEANEEIAGLKTYYQQQKADFYAANGPLVDSAILAIQDAYARTNFPDQKVNSKTHFDNLEHKDAPGCFRCHDGQHLNANQEAVRLECNLCHSVPVVSSPNSLTASLELSKGFEPESHKNASWINLHRTIFDETCAGCHTVEDAGGISNTSFCSNSACHGAKWSFAGFDAPKVREIMMEQAKAFITPTPEQPVATAAPSSGPLTYEGQIASLLKSKCGSCHGKTAMGGLNLLTYADLIKGSESGPVVKPGDVENSKIVIVQSASTKHFGQFTADQLNQIKQWILEGAAEK
jgi:mono/diheme cytochrome c family protein